jgi:hypothetical protein
LDPFPSGNTEDVERKIVCGFKALANMKDDDKRQQQLPALNELLKILGVDDYQVVTVVRESILCSFLCNSVAKARKLQNSYLSGTMKDTLEKIFALLTEEKARVSQLTWTQHDYEVLLCKLGEFKGSLPQFSVATAN